MKDSPEERVLHGDLQVTVRTHLLGLDKVLAVLLELQGEHVEVGCESEGNH